VLQKRRYSTKEPSLESVKPKLARSRFAEGLAKIKVEKTRLLLNTIDLTAPLDIVNISIKEEI